MRPLLVGLAALMFVTAASLAAARWNGLPIPDGYSDPIGAALPTDSDSVNTSNCYDACASIWGHPAELTKAADIASQ